MYFSVARVNWPLKVEDSYTLVEKSSCAVQWLFLFPVARTGKTTVGRLTRSCDYSRKVSRNKHVRI